MQTVRQKKDEKIVGISRAVLSREVTAGRKDCPHPGMHATIEQDEAYARKMQQRNAIVLFYLGCVAALKVFALYLITLDTLVSCFACVGMTMYWWLVSVSEEAMVVQCWKWCHMLILTTVDQYKLVRWRHGLVSLFLCCASATSCRDNDSYHATFSFTGSF